MNCPRCGELMIGGICDNCGFPMRRTKKIIPQGTMCNMRCLNVRGGGNSRCRK